MSRGISDGELLEFAHKAEYDIECYNSLVDSLYRLAGELDTMLYNDDEHKLMIFLKNGRRIFCALPELR